MKRKNYNKKIKLIKNLEIICIVITCLIVILSILSKNYNLVYFTVLSLFILFALSCFKSDYLRLKDEEEIYECKINNSRCLKKYFENVIYEPKKGINIGTIRKKRMLYGDYRTSTDYLKGVYKNIEFEFSNVSSYDTHNTHDGGYRYNYYFIGYWITINYNVDCDLKIFDRKIYSMWKSDLFIFFSKYKKIQLKNEEFNKNFIVYVKKGRECIDDKLIEKVLRLKNSCNGNLVICTDKNKIHIAINNKALLKNTAINDYENDVHELIKILDVFV